MGGVGLHDHPPPGKLSRIGTLGVDLAHPQRCPATPAWLAGWLNEAGSPRIEHAAEIAGLLAELPAEPQAMQVILGMLRRKAAAWLAQVLTFC